MIVQINAKQKCGSILKGEKTWFHCVCVCVYSEKCSFALTGINYTLNIFFKNSYLKWQ